MIVVTGGTGFIGSNLVAGLEDRGETDLVVCDRLMQTDKCRNIGKRQLAALVSPEQLPEFLEGNAAEIRAVFHMGAISSTTETDVDLIVETNVHLSADLWRWCARNGVPFIYASSAATYGDGSIGFDDDGSVEGLSRLRPMNPYGWSKQLFDRMVARWVDEGAPTPPQWVGLKFFNVYGPNEYHKGHMQSLVSKTFRAAAAGDPVTLFRSHDPDYPDGGQMRDFVYVEDCVAVMLWLLDHPDTSGLFNLGTGRARTFLDLIGSMFAALEMEPVLDWIDTPSEIRDRYQYHTQAEMGSLKKAGYHLEFMSVEDGVGAYVRLFLATDDPYR
ncbi:MAG: ADP-glyceromanno-heptose 6-epimerase [Gemmatimonadetes bacterium]|nr:ADP-glyceromanno-heptose 6-epimerase [Gemmatimonadota bacterium]